MLFKSGTSRQIGRTKFSMTLYSGDDLSQEGSVHYTRPCIPMKTNMHAGVKSAHSQIICCPQIGKIVLQHAQTKQRAAQAFLMGRSPSGFSYQEVGVDWGVVWGHFLECDQIYWICFQLKARKPLIFRLACISLLFLPTHCARVGESSHAPLKAAYGCHWIMVVIFPFFLIICVIVQWCDGWCVRQLPAWCNSSW